MERIILEASKVVALDSPDHIMPWGTKNDNSRNRRFNQKLYALFPLTKRISILDLGCSGGGFVKDCLDDGMFAVGLEGSDFSQKHKRAEWRTIPEYLFTCDVSELFSMYVEDQNIKMPLKFDVITSWELIEHIAEAKLSTLISNILRHLDVGGLWIISVSPNTEIKNGVHLHQTVRPEKWWRRLFENHGLKCLDQYVRYFNTQFIRGPKYGAPKSFHFVLGRSNETHPVIPSERFAVKMFDRWNNCCLNRMIRLAVCGQNGQL